MKGKFKKILAAVLCAALVLVSLPAAVSFAGSSESSYSYDLISLLNWLDSEDCTVQLTDTQKSDISTALSLYNRFSAAFDLTDDDDAAYLDNVLKSLDEIDTLSELVTTDDNFTGYNAFYTNFTMLTGSAYTANVSIDALAHVSSYSTFSSTEGLAWGYTDPSTGWYTAEKVYFDKYKTSLGYSSPITYGSTEYSAIVKAASAAGYTTGHYTNLFRCGTTQLIGVGYTTERGGAGYSKTWSYNTCSTSSSKSGTATYTTDEIYDIIAVYICEVVNGGSHTWDSGTVTTAATEITDGVMTYTCTVCGETYTETIAAYGNGLFKNSSGVWAYYTDGKIDTTYTGLAKNDYGWWYVNAGYLDLTYTGMAKNAYGWWYVTDGMLDTSYTGLASNDYGTWYMVNGALASSVSGLTKVGSVWVYLTNGMVNTGYTGLADNSYGTWYIVNGYIDTSASGMTKAGSTWVYLSNGMVDTTYTGLAKNAYGWWYINAGYLDLTYTGMAKNDYGWWYVTDGKLDLTYTGMAKNAYGWWYMTNGMLDTSYTGLASNDYGTWYMVNGQLTYYTGTVTIGGVKYTVVNGKVTS